MSDALEHVRYSCGIAGEEVANYVDQRQAKVAELEAENARLRADNIAFARNLKGKSATTGATYEHICTQLTAAQEEIKRMKRERLLTADAIESMHASHKDQLAKAEQRIAELIAELEHIREQKNLLWFEFSIATQKLAAEQLNNKLLREALTTCVCAMQDYQAGIGITEMFDKGEWLGRKALATTISTEALDAYVAERVKEYN